MENKDKEKLEQLINKLNLSEEKEEVIQIPIIPELWEDKDEDYKEALEKYFNESNLLEEEKEEIRKELLFKKDEDEKISEEQLKKIIDVLEENRINCPKEDNTKFSFEDYLLATEIIRKEAEEEYEDELDYIKIILEERMKMCKKTLKVIYKEYYEHLKDIGIIKEED